MFLQEKAALDALPFEVCTAMLAEVCVSLQSMPLYSAKLVPQLLTNNNSNKLFLTQQSNHKEQISYELSSGNSMPQVPEGLIYNWISTELNTGGPCTLLGISVNIRIQT